MRRYINIYNLVANPRHHISNLLFVLKVIVWNILPSTSWYIFYVLLVATLKICNPLVSLYLAFSIFNNFHILDNVLTFVKLKGEGFKFHYYSMPQSIWEVVIYDLLLKIFINLANQWWRIYRDGISWVNMLIDQENTH